MVLLPGSTLGNYRIVEPLGRGGMASVYKAYEPGLDRYVALKILPAEFLHEPSFSERFQREAQLVAKLEHPNIVPIHAFGIDEGVPWMAMRLVAGGTLSAFLKKGLPQRARVLQILRDVAAALDYAHGKGVVHRDVKPHNILLATEDDRVYLADFGIARMLEGSRDQTKTGAIVGTPEYMAPEQVRGERVDRRCDIYALGIVAFEALTGDVPFSADTPVGVLMKHLSDAIPLPAATTLPEPIVRVLLKALAKEPDRRWAGAGIFLKELGAVLTAGRDVPLPTIALGSAAGPTTRVRSWWPAILAAGLVLGLSGAALLWFRIAPHTPASQRQMPFPTLASRTASPVTTPSTVPAASLAPPLLPPSPPSLTHEPSQKPERPQAQREQPREPEATRPAVPESQLPVSADARMRSAYERVCNDRNAGPVEAARACTELGYLYVRGEGVERDPQKAVPLLSRGCEGAIADACSQLGYLYVSGAGVERDPQKAVALFNKGCDGGNAWGCSNLGVCYRDGTGVARDLSRAAAYFEQACRGDFSQACVNLGFMYDKANGVPKDARRARELYGQACDEGNAMGCSNLGIIYATGAGVPQDMTKAAAHFAKGCDGAEVNACVALGLVHERGDGTQKDAAKAAMLYGKACADGSPKGCARLGSLYERGDGVERDLAKAKTLYERGCDGADVEACAALRKLSK